MKTLQQPAANMSTRREPSMANEWTPLKISELEECLRKQEFSEGFWDAIESYLVLSGEGLGLNQDDAPRINTLLNKALPELLSFHSRRERLLKLLSQGKLGYISIKKIFTALLTNDETKPRELQQLRRDLLAYGSKYSENIIPWLDDKMVQRKISLSEGISGRLWNTAAKLRGRLHDLISI